ncbi:hypothetical protein C2R22_05930 [Salinigranum rubrum]|uniref:Uncharacterized protein n=1 Tax=Salinigranum rubrum TaxID=755307 RepID=A0A2I8VH54_9EURY|nr:hypothetical protein [Salinigranum rubrum]AUV81257.1 hypothetical protein C2R22_05930 [Salinigranum rubrum]
MGSVLLGACLGIAGWCLIQMILSAIFLGEQTTFTWATVAMNAGLVLVALFVAVLTFVGVL